MARARTCKVGEINFRGLNDAWEQIMENMQHLLWLSSLVE
jgi:hypothetical protein